MLSHGVTELQSDGFVKLQSCRVGELQRYIHSLELQSCIIEELLSPRVAEASQGIVNWGPKISWLGNRGVGWMGLGWGRMRDLGQACCVCW